jgi:Flp pilus assembly pilin Flp
LGLHFRRLLFRFFREKKINSQIGEKMSHITIFSKKILKEEEGMESVEFGIIAALVIIVGVGVWSLLGDSIRGVLTDLISALA